jgi:hypothetical protein
VDVAQGAGGVVGHGLAEAVLVVAAGQRGVHQAERAAPHGRSGQVDGDVPRAAHAGASHQRRGRAGHAQVAGDVVVDQPGDRKPGLGCGAPGAIGPRIAAAAAAAITMEIIDTEPGPEREEAVAAAMRFLDGGTAAL